MTHAPQHHADQPAVSTRRTRRGRRLTAIVGLGVLALLGPTAAGAAVPAATPRVADEPGVTFGLQPTQEKDKPFRGNFEFDLKPGTEIKDTVRLRNASSGPLDLKIFASDAKNAEGGAVDLLPTGVSSEDIGSWIKLGRTELRIDGNEFLDIPFTMTVPANASPGDHTGGIVASYTGPATDANGAAVIIDRRIGTRILLRVDGKLTPAIKISDLKTSWDGPLSPLGRGTMNVSYRVSNIGNVRMGTNQSIKFKSPIGMPSKEVKLDPIPDLLPGNAVLQEHKVDGVWPTFRTSTTVIATPIALKDGDIFQAGVTERAKAGNWTIPFGLIVLILLLAIGKAYYDRRKRQEKDLEQARLHELVDARLGAGNGYSGDPGQPFNSSDGFTNGGAR